MKKNYADTARFVRTLRTLISFVLCITAFLSVVKAQTIIYSTDFGTVANVNPINWTFSGSGMNISTNNASTGYNLASGGACLGEGNSVTFTNTAGVPYASSPLGLSEAILLVSSTGYTNVALSFGMRKSSAGYNSNATYTLAWSTNGTSYTPIVYTEATAGSWDLVSGAGLLLPAAAANSPSLFIKWSFDRTGTASNFKIDDVKINGNVPVISPATVSFLSNDTTVSEASPSALIYLRLTSASSASSAVTVSVSALSNASAADYSLPSQTIIIPANSPINATFPVTINVVNDAIAESAEYLILRLVNPVNAVIGSTGQCSFYIGDNDRAIPAPSNAINLNFLARFSNGTAGNNSAEIVVHDPSTQRLYIANSIGGKLDIVDFINPSSPVLLSSISVTPYGNINCVAVHNGTVAVAIENINPQDSGKVVFYNADGVFLKQVKVGMMPDMLTFNNAGTRVITANEGEPNTSYTNDPDGSVSIINISGGITNLNQSNVSHITFTAYNGQESSLRTQGIRIFGLNASASKDFEPEYVAVAKDDTRCWVTLQENNAIVEINLLNNTITTIKALGTKDHSLLNNGLDASNLTKGVNISNFPIKGFYLPDAIASYSVGGSNYLITANEGDTRAYSGFSEETRIASLNLDPLKFPLAGELKNNYVLGRLTVTNRNGDTDLDGDIDTVYSVGARSFSIWNANTGVQVYDSKDDIEMITATNSFSNMFNVSNSNSTKKDRSDDKGPEPEGVAIGTIGTSIYAFIALERVGGVMVYDVTNPLLPVFVTYVNNRTLPGNGPDLGAEGIIFIPQSQSPNGQHLVIAANEVSSSLSIWGIPGCNTPLATALSVNNGTNNCPGVSVLSVPASTNTHQWFSNGTLIPGANSNTYSPVSSGNYAVVINGGVNCTATSLSQSIVTKALPVINIAGVNTLCAGSSVTQTVSGAVSYTWATSGSTSTVVTLSPFVTSNFSVTGTGTNNCIAGAVKSITVNALPVLSITTSDQDICAGESVSISAAGATTYTWSTAENSQTIVISPASTVTYSVTGMLQGCSASLAFTQSVSACVGLNEEVGEVNALVIYPNPGSDFVTFSTTKTAFTSVDIVDGVGKIVKSFFLNDESQQICVSDLHKGIYLALIKVGGKVISKKLVIE